MYSDRLRVQIFVLTQSQAQSLRPAHVRPSLFLRVSNDRRTQDTGQKSVVALKAACARREGPANEREKAPRPPPCAWIRSPRVRQRRPGAPAYSPTARMGAACRRSRARHHPSPADHPQPARTLPMIDVPSTWTEVCARMPGPKHSLGRQERVRARVAQRISRGRATTRRC
jgi:hypothetical protein